MRLAGDDQTDYTNTKYCNSIGCSDGYTPIENAHDVKCEDGKCEEEQCCEAFCSYYACPNNYTPVYGADTLKCEGAGCTTDLCCKKGEIRLEAQHQVADTRHRYVSHLFQNASHTPVLAHRSYRTVLLYWYWHTRNTFVTYSPRI